MRESALPKHGPRTQVGSVSGVGMCVCQDEFFFIHENIGSFVSGESEGRWPDLGREGLIEIRDFLRALVTQCHYAGPQ